MKLDADAMLECVIAAAAEKLAERAEARLTPERIAALEARAIERRIGRLTLAEAMPRLGCAKRATLLAVCRARRIPILTESRKRRFILIADIEAADARDKGAVPGCTALAVEEEAPLSHLAA